MESEFKMSKPDPNINIHDVSHSAFSSDLLDLIPYGRENAINAVTIASLLGEDTRVIRANIARYRRKGILICSNTDRSKGHMGYFRPVCTEEIKDFVELERARIRSHKAAIAPAERELRKRGRGNESEAEA